MADEETNGSWYPIVVLVLSIVLAVGSLSAGIFYAHQDHSQAACWAERGARGDFWGGHIGAAATLAGSFLFFGALLLQSNELKLQRKELVHGRTVAKEQAGSLAEQSV